MKQVLQSVLVIVAVSFSLSAQAQFHKKDKGGQTVVTPQTQNSAVARAHAQSGMSVDQIAKIAKNGAMYLPDWAQKSGKDIRLGTMDHRQTFHWGQRVTHADKSYTLTRQDDRTVKVVQETFSANDVKKLKRLISLDEYGLPGESIVYDAADKLKYRGSLIYENSPRLMISGIPIRRIKEEMIFDAQGTLLRRTLHHYDIVGKKLPVVVYDYVPNIPSDLELVITEREENAEPVEEPRRFRLFGGNRENRNNTIAPAGGPNPGAASQPRQPQQGKGILNGIFKGNNRNR